jgi:Holliday junction DNA helicase RuvB
MSLRPQRLIEFVGQEQIKKSLRIYIDAALTRGEALDHSLFYGPPGLGKTTLAEMIARELGVGFHATSGPAVSKAEDLVGLLTALGERDVLFIDEVHRLRPQVEEFLYSAMEDYRIDIRQNGRGVVQHFLPRFTLVGATTRLGMLTAPMRARFGIEQRLDLYPVEEIERIVVRSADVLGAAIDEDGAREIAKRSRGTPRIANRLLRRVRDCAQRSKGAHITRASVDEALELLEVDEFGLDEMDARILKTLIHKFNGGPVGIVTLATAIGEEAETIEEVNEPFLIQSGFLERTPRGRVVTARARARYNGAV